MTPWADFIAENLRTVRAIAAASVPTSDVADVAQAAALSALRTTPRAVNDAQQMELLKIVARRAVADYHRRPSLRASSLDAPVSKQPEQATTLHDVIGGDGGIDDADRRDFLRRALGALPARAGRALGLSAAGYTAREMAAALDVTEANAYQLVHRGREAIAA